MHIELRRKLSLAILLWAGTCLFTTSRAQYHPGYYLAMDGDTVHGYIGERGEARNARSLAFKTEARGGEVTHFAPGEVREYQIAGGKRYRSMALPNGQRSFTEPDGREVRWDTLFAAVLIRGRINLYSTRDARGYQHVYFEHEGQVRELVDDIPPAFRDRGDLFATRAMLQSLFADCPEVAGRVEQTPIRPLRQQQLFDEYLNCEGTGPAEYLFPFEKTRFRPRLVAGGGFSNCKFNYLGANRLDGVRLNYRSGFVAGLGLSVLPPGPWSISADAVIQSIRGNAASEWYVTGISNTQYQWHLTGLSLRTPVLLRYSFAAGKIRPYVQAGGAFGFWLQNEFMETKIVNGPRGHPVYTTRPFWSDPEFIGRMEQSLIGAVGVAFGRLSIEFRYERGNGFTAARSWHSTTQTWQTVAAFQF